MNCELVLNILSLVTGVLFNLTFLMTPTFEREMFQRHIIWFALYLFSRCLTRTVPYLFKWIWVSIFERTYIIIYLIFCCLYFSFTLTVCFSDINVKPYARVSMTIDYIHMLLLVSFSYIVKPITEKIQITTKVINVLPLPHC